MLDNAVLLENFVEDGERTTAIHQIIFRDHLKPVDRRFLGQDMRVVRNAQADTNAVIGEAIETVGGHGRESATTYGKRKLKTGRRKKEGDRVVGPVSAD